MTIIRERKLAYDALKQTNNIHAILRMKQCIKICDQLLGEGIEENVLATAELIKIIQRERNGEKGTLWRWSNVNLVRLKHALRGKEK